MKWLNLGGGHHITRADYDMDRLVRVVKHFREKYGVEVYLEPGEAVVLNAGFLVSTVLEIVHNGMDIAILDTSAACHMPDVLEMPYRPPVKDSGKPGEKPYTYRLTGPPAWPGTSSGTTPSTTPWQRAARSSWRTWRCTPWSRPTPSTACPCLPSPCAMKTARWMW